MKSDPYAVTDAIFWGELVQQAYDMYEKSAAGTLTPPVPAQPGLPEGWELIYYLVVKDQVLFFKANVSFGYILFNSAQDAYGIVIRGTDGTLEWIEDVEAILTGFLVGTKNYGNVESGFLREFQNLRVYAPTGQDLGPLPNWLATLPPAASVVAAGHSLGAAVATIVGAQTAIQGLTTRIYSFASPQVGDSHFAALFDNLSLDHYRIYNIHDLVPKVPSLTLGYYAVDTAIEIDSDNGKVKTNVPCCHSLRTYLAILGSLNYAVDPVCLVPVTTPAS